MTDIEWKFLQDQRSERNMYCLDYVDKKWSKPREKRNQDLRALEKMRKFRDSEQYMSTVTIFDSSEASAEDIGEESYKPSDEAESDPPTRKKRIVFQESEALDDPLPSEFKYVRCSIRKVRPEFYEIVNKLKSCLHMSQNQAEAAVLETANKMFGRHWKCHNEGGVIEKKSVRDVGKSNEIMAHDQMIK
ncbi:uncharacterized protein LOC106461746 [Limulus polyphemus]|uniref:Uncharacterized protein LOC106461746 n=1 Tax=Limulus polyphemus TaxID=6850 RepID=A0ABM1B8N1_LIMPO|nr:uncharacterized protein LOC106461746 [Limulus polyphemus]